jgi:tRNA threonylcarbamoyladenosine biosynthesis protein TsaE
MNKWEIGNINDLDKVAGVVLEKAKKTTEESGEATVIALHGNLGAGKTVFTKQLAKDLGITETVTSPTFVIQKSFDIPEEKLTDTTPFKKLIHIDTYRIDLQDELTKLGWDDNLINKENLIAVEWPENIPDILPKNTINLHFTFVDETTRLIELK